MNGILCKEWCGVNLPIQICKSAAGFYIGCMSDHEPMSRESVEYFRTLSLAEEAFADGTWTQRLHP